MIYVVLVKFETKEEKADVISIYADQPDCHAGRSVCVYSYFFLFAFSVFFPAKGSGEGICGKRRSV